MVGPRGPGQAQVAHALTSLSSSACMCECPLGPSSVLRGGSQRRTCWSVGRCRTFKAQSAPQTKARFQIFPSVSQAAPAQEDENRPLY